MASPAEAQKLAHPAPTSADFQKVIQPFIAKNCFGCHNAKLRSGEVDLQSHSTRQAALQDREIWEHVVQKLRTGEMPPKGLPRPKQEEVRRVTEWIIAEYDRIDRNTKPDPGRVTARRLNRYEYDNTVRDLLEIGVTPAEDFPDDSGYGFDNIGDVLSLSPVLMEKYLNAAEKIAQTAIVTKVQPVKPTRSKLEAERLYPSGRSPAKQKDVFGPLLSLGSLHAKKEFPAAGEYDFRFQLGGIRPEAVEPLQMAFWLDGKKQATFEVHPKGGEGLKRAFEIRLPVTPGSHMVGLAFLNDAFVPASEAPDKRNRWLAIDSIEILGPFDTPAPALPGSHTKIFTCMPVDAEDSGGCGKQIVSRLARKAFRRPVTETEVDGLVEFIRLAKAEGDSFERGVQVALQAMLVSPHFLFRIERDANPADRRSAHAISSHELASRLSYFLWSTIPDTELDGLADSGALSKPAVLRAQVKRMLQHPKSAALAENFAGQWLHLRNLEDHKPDPDKFPEFDDSLRAAMGQETRLFFAEVVREDRSVLDFIDADFTYLNERLAAHYTVEGVSGEQFRRVALTGGQRGGVLTHASILTVSSYPTRTSPVIRGKWILENLLNAPPPPPPPGVANLDEEAVGSAGSLRQQLEKHRSNPTCSSCHARMDPLGFGLENYDAIGTWRTVDGAYPIDSTGTLPNGKSFSTPSELKTILKNDSEEFVRCLTEKLLIYGIGRGLERYDRPAVQSISQRVKEQGNRFSALIVEIVSSLPFQMRRGEGMPEKKS